MKQKIIVAVLFVSLLVPAISSAQVNRVMPQNSETAIGRILSLIKDRIDELENLLVVQRQISENVTGAIIQKIAPAGESQSDDCNNYDKICPISPYGTYKEPQPISPTSTVPQFTIKYVDVRANLATINYSVSDIQDNQTTYWLDYGTSSSTLNSATPSVNISYGITGRHGLDDSGFLLVDSSACLYASSTPGFGTFLLYNPDAPTYYFRFEAKNNLGTFFTPSLDLSPFSFQFDGFCGEQTYYIEDLQADV